MNKPLHVTGSASPARKADQENAVLTVRSEFEVVLREAANARERFSCAEHLLNMARQVAPELQTEYTAAKQMAFVADQRLKNVTGRIISFGLLSYDEIQEISAHYGY
jgi:hypothetical protein